MQQNVRMVCASFLVQYLSHDWREGASWFNDTLVDADPAINSMMWQNCASCGLDPWNFNVPPTLDTVDVSGQYVAKWLPELA